MPDNISKILRRDRFLISPVFPNSPSGCEGEKCSIDYHRGGYQYYGEFDIPVHFRLSRFGRVRRARIYSLRSDLLCARAPRNFSARDLTTTIASGSEIWRPLNRDRFSPSCWELGRQPVSYTYVWESLVAPRQRVWDTSVPTASGTATAPGSMR